MHPSFRHILPCLLFAATVACHTTATPPAHLGAACAVDADCISTNCSNDVCTRTCTTQGDCPVGFDCRITAVGDAGSPLCIAAHYPQPDAGDIGTNCTAVAAGCPSDGGSPCAEGLTCHAINNTKCDPQAYCTTETCTTDLDCPPAFRCADESWRYVDGGQDSFHGCIKRERCDDCDTDESCPAGFVCAHDALGGRFCGQSCTKTDDCLKPFSSDTGGPGGNGMQYGSFEVCTPNPVTMGSDGGLPSCNNGSCVCTPLTGACHGKSAFPSVSGNGQICSPCRVNTPGDCATGLQCIQEYEGEEWCTQGCQMTLTLSSSGWSLGNDPCPSPSSCYFSGSAGLNAGCYNFVKTLTSCQSSTDCPQTDGQQVCVDPGVCARVVAISPCTLPGWCTGHTPDYEGDTCYPNP